VLAGQWFVSPEGTRWHFDAGAPSLDFVHTWGWGMPKPEWERLGTPAELGRWLADRYGSDPAATADDRAAALDLRAAITQATLRTAAGGRSDPADVDTINRFAAEPDIPPYLSGGRRPAPVGRPRAALAMLARDAIAVLSRPERIRHCGAGDCLLVFVDDSRGGTRRWCSMQRCGNRAKARNHRHRPSEES
jgi:predicted RNA-binding Zn ribbon-like protein